MAPRRSARCARCPGSRSRENGLHAAHAGGGGRHEAWHGRRRAGGGLGGRCGEGHRESGVQLFDFGAGASPPPLTQVLEEKQELLKDFEKNSSFSGAQAHLNKGHSSKRDWCAAAQNACAATASQLHPRVPCRFTAKLEQQWGHYDREQRRTPDWANATMLIDSGLLLQDVRSPLARLLLCNWFNEFHRFMERDLIAFSYIVMAMGLSPRPGCAGPLHLVDPKWHWYNTALRETDVAFRCGHRSEFKRGCEYLKKGWPI